MSQPFDPEGPVGLELKKNLIVELTNKFNIADDAEDVAEYIIVLIVSNKTSNEIINEVKEITDIRIDEAFVNSIYQEIGRLLSIANGSSELNQQTTSTPQQPQVQTPPVQIQPEVQQEPQVEPVNDQMQDQDVMMQPSNLPTGPKGMQRNFQNNRFNKGGINKGNRTTSKKSFALQNSQNFEKAMNMNVNGANTNIKQFVQKPSKGRCQDFPYCNNKDCELAHPTKTCFAYPNCTNPPGTCNYLHPGEDSELIAKLEKTKKEYREKKKIEHTGTLGICKYGMLCSKEICPFAHPTPANKDAKVLVLQWCPGGKACQDPNCTKSHPSPNYQAPPKEIQQPIKPEKILEQCKFGPACTNFKCPRRHAKSIVPCREGANCQRLDCFFSHPIDEDCRFGAQCKNKNCLFRHPEGREIQSNTWSKDSANTDQRHFAVPEDQVLEQAMQES